MILTPSIALGTTLLSAIRDSLNAGGAGNPAKIDIYSGTKPARPDTATTTQVKLGTLTCSDDCGVVSTINNTPTLTFNTVTPDAAADETGVAAWGRISRGGGGPAELDFDISTVGGSGFGQMNTTNIVKDGPIAATTVVITL